jgi:hypothetical protein
VGAIALIINKQGGFMRAVVNGKLIDLPEGATVEDLRSRLPEIGNDDVMEEGFGGTKPLKNTEALKEGSKVWTVPKIVKGNHKLVVG